MRTLVSGGPILSCDEAMSSHEALVIENGRVLAVGAQDEMASLAGAGAERLDLDGATAMPGLVDGHSHHQHFAALQLGTVDLSDARDHDDIVERIRAVAAVTPPGQWIRATPVGEAHYFVRRSYRDLTEQVLPDRHVLDRATTDHPVIIQGWTPTTPSVTAFNSLGLREVGIDRGTPDVVGTVTIEKDGEVPNGRLLGPVYYYYTSDPFWLSILAKMPPPPEGIWDMGARAAMATANQAGITSAYVCHAMHPEHIQGWQNVRDADELTLRVLAVLDVANWSFEPTLEPTPDYIRARLELATALTQVDDDMMRVNGVTLGRGGVIATGAFRHRTPYRHPLGGMGGDAAAIPKWVEEMVVKYCCENDLRLNMNMYSYLDHEDFFHSIEPYVEKYDIKSRDWVAQHCLITSAAQAKRYAELKFQITVGAGFGWGMGDTFVDLLGEEVLADLSPMKRFVDLGLNVSACIDWGPSSPFEQMWLAETHESAGSGHRNLLAGQVLTRQESLATWTRNGGRLMQWEGIGALLPGYHADLAIVDRNPLTCPLDDLPAAEVLRTVVAGQTVYDAGALVHSDAR
ncbi:amidohydrolase [Georgenia sp. SYP-B2076]|uniref:amidohydrolase n=1 Tax=Georgenia sp. SYP-B2076 TaxID=2495881 RepID=UPI000F8D6DAD|nr:amidohydrolase family protein [Georgenia sp. SYP-B2076]